MDNYTEIEILRARLSLEGLLVYSSSAAVQYVLLGWGERTVD